MYHPHYALLYFLLSLLSTPVSPLPPDPLQVNVDFVVNNEKVTIPITPASNTQELAREFCSLYFIVDDPHCSLHVHLELSSKLHCSSSHSNPNGRTFQFVHSPLHHDSEEFDLLRDTFERYGYKECWPGPEGNEVR